MFITRQPIHRLLRPHQGYHTITQSYPLTPRNMPSLKVRRATRADIPRIAIVCEDAFSSDPIFKYMYADSILMEKYAWRRNMFEEEWEWPGRRGFVVESEDSEILAFANWYFPYSLTAEEEAAGVGQDVVSESDPLPAGVNKTIFMDFFSRLYSYRNKYVDHDSCYVLDMLVVHPDHQRKGLGRMLLEHVLTIVDEEGKNAYLEASVKGLGLYLKKGWKEIDELLIDMRPYGGEGIEVEKIMMRDAKAV